MFRIKNYFCDLFEFNVGSIIDEKVYIFFYFFFIEIDREYILQFLYILNVQFYFQISIFFLG